MANEPLARVSAVIPVYNGADFVAEAIDSVLAQTQAVVECIVVDDGSTDTTPEIVAGFGAAVRYVRQEGRAGVSAARNRGTQLAAGELVAFLDHDDVWLPHKLELQLPAVAREGATLVMCALRVVDAGGHELDVKRLGALDQLLAGMLLFDGTDPLSCSSTGVFRRDRLLAMGGFDPALSMSADWDVLWRTLLEGRVAYVDEPLVLYRVHGSNMSHRVRTMETDMRRSFAKAFGHEALPPALRERRREAYGRLYRMLAGSYRDQGRRRDAVRALTRAAAYDPHIALDLARGRRA